ncbi:MAG: hypothetical protein ACUVQY_11420 [Thermoproteota archaeon]
MKEKIAKTNEVKKALFYLIHRCQDMKNIKSLILFGSLVRGEYVPNFIRNEILRNFGVTLDFMVYREDELLNFRKNFELHPVLIKEIVAGGAALYGKATIEYPPISKEYPGTWILMMLECVMIY